MAKRYLESLSVALVCVALLSCADTKSSACTIFVLTDTNRTLFCNNEDWSDPKTRIWFVPGDDKHYGAVYVGFDNDYAQGGMNTKGLAFDWVAGYSETWKPDPKLPVVWGNSGQEALEHCATVEEAIAFYRGHQDAGFFRAKILLADRTGASVIIGGKDNQLQVEPANTCRGFGYGESTLREMLTKTTPATVANGARILRAALQKGRYATKYFNIFDLTTGDIFLYPQPEKDEPFKFNLTTELKNGGHFYDMPQIQKQLAQPPRPLSDSMQRITLDHFKPIPDKEPEVTAHVRTMLQDVLDGTMRAEDYAPDLWQVEAPKQKQNQEEVKALGRFVALTLVDRSGKGNLRYYRYRVEFEKNTLLQRLVFDDKNKLVASSTEDSR